MTYSHKESQTDCASSSNTSSVSLVVATVLVGLGTLMALSSAKHLGFPVSGTLSTAAWVLIPLAGTALFSGRAVANELGLTRFSSEGVSVAILGSLGLFAGLAVDGGSAQFDLGTLWRGALRPGLTEELAFRGFAFGLLHWRARLPASTALLSQGLLFGAFHLPGALQKVAFEQALEAAAITGVGGCWFAWLYLRWNRSLWVPIAAHAAMNAWWVIYAAGSTAAGGGSGATWGRVLAITLITVGTIRRTCPEQGDDGITERME